MELSDVLNDDNDAFLATPLNREVKILRKTSKDEDWEEGTPEFIMIRAKNLRDESSHLKKDIKKKKADIEDLTRKTIEILSKDDINRLLDTKWIEPLLTKLSSIPSTIISTLKDAVAALNAKYEVTFADLDGEIRKTEHELAGMLDSLTGSDTDLAALAEFKTLLAGE